MISGLPRARVAAMLMSRVTPESETWYAAVPGTAHRKEGHGGIPPPANRMRTIRREAFIAVKM